MRGKTILFIAIVMPLPTWSALAAENQPWQVIVRDPQAYYVHQGPAMCGPTAFYMIFKYHGDHLAGPDNVDLGETIPSAANPVLDRPSKMAAWIAGQSAKQRAGTSWSQLEDAARNLKKGSAPFYSLVRSNARAVSDSNARRAIFTADIIPLLKDGIPVLIHLKRPGWFAGHYVVIIGYDPAADTVPYLDPNNRAFDPRNPAFDAAKADWPAVIERVGLQDFLGHRWYAPAGSLAAGWDGRWLGFGH